MVGEKNLLCKLSPNENFSGSSSNFTEFLRACRQYQLLTRTYQAHWQESFLCSSSCLVLKTLCDVYFCLSLPVLMDLLAAVLMKLQPLMGPAAVSPGQHPHSHCAKRVQGAMRCPSCPESHCAMRDLLFFTQAFYDGAVWSQGNSARALHSSDGLPEQ